MSITDNPREELGELPAGRPLQSEFHDDLDYPRLGGVTFRRGTLTENQQTMWNEKWPELGCMLEDKLIDIDSWFGREGAKTIVEIGSGTGTSTAATASARAR